MESQAGLVAVRLTLLAHANIMNERTSLILSLRSKQNKPQIQDVQLRELHKMIPSKLFMMCLMI